IAVFYSPELIFSDDDDVDYDAQPILIEIDGFPDDLLKSESVTAIAVDGANRKWIGTESSGVFLMSESGTTEIKHFDISNSPLLSNTIMDIAISQNGEVFIGTDRGIISYRSDSSAPSDTFEDIFAFPNPVYESYTGDIAITGLVSNTVFKITDIGGKLIYQADAEGGMGIWNGKTYDGNRVSTGVYLVFATKSDGTQSNVTKILVIN
ncbi:MAG: Por secretion system protein, partial [Bacteroidetes bacterium]|nr:Por secretion system protein [Bacteroidota bacterium]